MTITIETIMRRISVRSYDGQPLTPGEAHALRELIAAETRGPFGNPVRFVLAETGGTPGTAPRRIGTYGLVSGAHSFIAGAVRKGPGALEDYGYCMERLVLGTTALGLGTCWLGGNFSRTDVSRILEPEADELTPAITPVGHPAASRTLRERIIRGTAGSDRRKDFGELFFEGDLSAPLDPDAAGPWKAVLACVRSGPSASNKQPWRIIRTGAPDRPAFTLHLAEDRAYNNALGEIHIQNVDMGIAMANFEAAARALGLSGGWTAGGQTAAPLPCIATWEPV